MPVKRVLAIGAHPDDIELGCGATLAKLVSKGVHVRALILTAGDAGTRPGHGRCDETASALRLLGITDIVQEHLPDTCLDSHQSRVTAAIQAQCDVLRPDRVYTMFERDRHQDHRAVFQASIIACRRVPQVLSYEAPSSWPDFAPVVFESVDAFVDAKVAALSLHHSQAHRDYMCPEQVRCRLEFRGGQIGLGPCEGFMPYKVVL